MKKAKNLKSVICNLKIYLCLSAFIGGSVFLFLMDFAPRLSFVVSAENSEKEIEEAEFTRQEFFGAEAIVPLPTAEARENLARLAESEPNNQLVLEKFAEANEKLEKYDEAEKILLRLAEIDEAKLETLAAFYHRRARFDAEAEVLRKVLFSTAPEKRAEVFQRLIDLARVHDLNAYLNDDFYAAVVKENPNLFEIFERLIDNLSEEKNYVESLNFLRQAKRQFPENQNLLLDREIQILLESGQAKEAEKVYQAAFDPFWSAAEADKFYDFLNERNRLRAYGAQIKNRFRKNPADFDAAVRLALYQDHDYDYGNDDITPIISRLEQAKKSWTTAELVTATRLLLQNNKGETASRFLYTLYLREDFRQNGELRAKILYQLFEMFSDAENQRLPLTKGDLRFYEDVAKTDTNPGIATGILSLVFSDTNPREKLELQEAQATKFFNRAAAYRIFAEYKKEFPTSAELAQMYLDIVRLYAATGETEIAEKTLNEFAERFENSSDYAAVALKLADAFAALKQAEKEHEIYRKALDYVGKTDKPKFGWNSGISTNEGITIPDEKKKTGDHYYYQKPNDFKDYLSRRGGEISYEEVLKKYVSVLVSEKKTPEILALYSNEIAKYPNEEALYEQRLAWLEQTNLTEEQFQVYKTALARFPTNNWRDKLARFFLRQKRQTEFAEFSAELVGKLNDAELENYLSKFIDGGVSAAQFDKNLSLKLYQTAHARFPHNIIFVNKLLTFYRAEKRANEWRKLAAEYFFISREIREEFLNELARQGELRNYFARANGETVVYQLFRAETSVRLSNFENAVAAYEKLNEIYPHETEIYERLINLTRSFGQKNRESLAQAAKISNVQAEFLPVSARLRTQSGEIRAELGDYQNARQEWEKLIATAAGTKEIYLAAATVYWDYFQYEDARRTLEKLREKYSDKTLYAFEAGAILEAEHKNAEAIREYVKALGDEQQKDKAKNRLAKLFYDENETQKNLLKAANSAFESEKNQRRDASRLALGYAEFLTKIEQREEAETILNRAVAQSSDKEFLEAAREFYQTAENDSGEQIVLRRLAETAANPRDKIQFRLQLAESFEEENNRAAAKNILSNLIAAFPTNYGVITETSDFYWRLGYKNESTAVLQKALTKSTGDYKIRLAQKLSKKLIQINKLAEAAQILSRLHEENPSDIELFNELARVCVRLNDAEKLQKTFAEMLRSLRESDADRREVNEQIAALRVLMIDAFTRLKDYAAAVNQHIEIINREPDEENIENAIRYVKRYGGADVLLNYYLKLSQESFKNYRWNVVLAQIYEADNDWGNAVENYQAAIVNQPEMPELYLAIAEIETRRNNFEAALKNIDEVLALTNDDKQYVKKKIEILRKAGRVSEAQAEKAKLPTETEKKISADEFAEARKLQATEKEKSRALYRAAFEKLLENPLSGEIKATDISGFAESMRETEPLDKIAEKLWILREKLVAVADEINGEYTGAARTRISILDGAMTDSIGTTAKNFGTDAELAALHEDLQNRIAKNSFAADRHQTLSLVQDLSRRAGFGDLEEMILRKKCDETSSALERQTYLQNLINFYNERGAYQKIFDALEKYDSGNFPLKAQAAKLVGDREKELEALREIYWQPLEKFAVANDENVARFLEILHAENRAELKSLTEKSSAYQLQLINFLLARGEGEPAHAAIANAAFPAAWKLARNAEASLALKEFGETEECYFCEALQLDSIGEMIKQTPDKKRFLVGDDWFRLSREYGEWLFARSDKEIPPAKFLPAMVENQPRSAQQQFALGEFYLQKREFAKAVEHLRLSIEINEDETKLAALGAAYFLAGEKDLAEKLWTQTLENEQPENLQIYFQVLSEYGLPEKARERVAPFIVKFLRTSNAEDSAEFQNLIRRISASFNDETAKAKYFQGILAKRPTDQSLAEMLLNENLIAAKDSDFFYRRLIETANGAGDYDYDFQTILERTFDRDEAESIYEQENDYQIKEPESERLNRQKKYLETLLGRGENAAAQKIVAEIEKELEGSNARPAWLKLAKFQTQIRAGNFNSAEAKRFIGISVSEAAAKIIPPDVERFNDVRRILQAEKRETEKTEISAAFFARNLALEKFETANFIGFARSLFEKGEAEKALRILRLMIDAGDETKRETALAEIADFAEIKAQTPDAAKIIDEVSVSVSPAEALKFSAEIAAEFGKTDAALDFRQKLSEIDSADSINKIELARLLSQNDRKDEARAILRDIINDKNSPRSARWQAREILGETDFPNAKFDAFGQFYQGVSARKENAIDFFINSLIADKDAPLAAQDQLIKIYALTGKPFAALKLAESDKAKKTDELLQILSAAAEKIGDQAKAIEYEKAKSGGGNEERIRTLQKLAEEKNKRATDFTVDAENTRKL